MQFHANKEQISRYCDHHILDADVKQHIDHCTYCMHQVQEKKFLSQQLSLMTVEELSAGELEDSWVKISDALNNANKRSVRKPIWFGIAASMFLTMLFLVNRFNGLHDTQKNVDNDKPLSNLISIDKKDDAKVQLDQLVAYSRLIENRLKSLPQPRVVRANTADTVSQLQDQISMLDTRLSIQHQVPLTDRQRKVLWQQRVSSMNNLYRVRAAQLQRVSY